MESTVLGPRKIQKKKDNQASALYSIRDETGTLITTIE